MSAIRLIPETHAQTCKNMYDAAIPEMLTFYPGTIDPVSVDIWKIMLAQGGWGSTANNGSLRAFMLTPRRPVAFGVNKGKDAEQFFIWIAPSSLSNSAFAAANKEMMIAWLNDLVARSIPWWWSKNVMQYPNRTETWFQNIISKGVTVTVIDNWRYCNMTPQAGLAALSQI